jgi:hypothetical protein
MKQSDVFAELLDRGHQMLRRTLADFSDADMLVRPAPHANHAEWMLGHLCRSEAFMLGAAGGHAEGLLPLGFGDHYPQSKEHENEVVQPLGKVVLLEQFAAVRSRMIEFVRGLGDADLLKEVPSPFNKGSNTTVSFIIQMPGMHASMHVGQMQVIRRVLGKPILF